VAIDVNQALADPDFQALPFEEKRKALIAIDTDFAGLPREEQTKAMNALNVGQLPQERPLREAASAIYTPALEASGAVAGGLLAAPAAPLAGPAAPVVPVAGGALGFAAGKGAAARVDEVLGIKSPPQGLAEGMTEAVQGVKEGLMAEAGGTVLQKGLQAFTTPFATAQAAKIAEKANKFGVDLTSAEATGSKPLALLESMLDKIPFSAGMIQRFRGRQAQQLEDAAQNLIQAVGSTETKESAGQAVQGAIQKKYIQRLAVRDKLYDRLTQKVPKDSVVPTTHIQETADGLLQNEMQLPKAAQVGSISSFLAEMTKLRQEGLSFQGAKSLRERLGKLAIANEKTPEGFVYQRLKTALDKDIADYSISTGGEVKRAWERANWYHGAVKNLAEDSNIKKVVNANPERVIDTVFKPGATTEVKLLRKAVNKGDFRNLQNVLVNRLFQGQANQNPSQALVSNLKKYGEDTLSAAIPTKTLNALKEFAEVASKAHGAEKIAGNPSGTAQNVISFAQGIFFITNPVKGAVAVIAPPTMARMYLSEFGRKYLTQGVRTPVGTPQAAQLAGRIASMARMFQAE